MKYICTTEKWKALGQPDVNSVIYLRNRKDSKKVYFQVVSINYGHKKGIAMNLQKLH